MISLIVDIIDFFTLGSIHDCKCNRCNQETPKEKRIVDSGYDDYGFQCIACATDTGLLKENQHKEQFQKRMLKRRKEFGL